jgi:hypothetical protein
MGSRAQRHSVPPKRRYTFTTPYGVTILKTIKVIFNAVWRKI